MYVIMMGLLRKLLGNNKWQWNQRIETILFNKPRVMHYKMQNDSNYDDQSSVVKTQKVLTMIHRAMVNLNGQLL